MKVYKVLKKEKKYLVAVFLILVAFVVTRFLFLGMRPIHHDEGMLSYFAWRIIKDHDYIYTPQIHGPILFYVQAIIFRLFGTSDAATRLGPAIFGVILGMIPFIFVKYLGKNKALAISALILVSPLLMYYARFLVHTALSIVFLLVFVLLAWRFFVSFNSNYLLWAAAALALAFGTSETTYIFVAVIFAFIPLFFLLEREKFIAYWRKTCNFVREQYPDVISAFLIFVLVWTTIYSVGFTNPKSFILSLPNPFNKETGLGFWLAQHKVHLGGQPWYYYLILLAVYEPFAVAAAFFGLLNYAKTKSAFFLFLAWWALGELIAFSIAGEKFPWLILPTLIAISTLGGYYLGWGWAKFRPISKIIWMILFVFSAFVAIRLSFIEPVDTRELAVYVQTPLNFQKVIDEVTKNCQGAGNFDCVLIDSKISWPLSWNFRDFGRLDNLESNLESRDFPAQTKYIIVSSERINKFKALDGWERRRVTLRDWWVPDVCREPSCISKFIKYFLFRETWNEKGGYDVYIYRRVFK